MNNIGNGRGLHSQVKRKAERKGGVSMNELKPNEKKVAERLVQIGALHSVCGKLVWQGA
jgi:hypothetical protein